MSHINKDSAPIEYAGFHDGNGHIRNNGSGDRNSQARRPLLHLPSGEVIEVGWEEGRKQERSSADERPAKAVEFVRSWLDPNTPIELVESPQDPSSLHFAMRRDGKIQQLDHLDRQGTILIPPARSREPFRSMSFPAACLAYKSPMTVATECGEFLHEIVPLSDCHKNILGAFVLHTWVWDRLPFTVCPIILGPPDFTNTLLRALSLLCRRSVVTAGATSRGIVEAYSEYDVTLLVAGDALGRTALRALDTTGQPGMLHLYSRSMVSAFGPRLLAASESRDELWSLQGGFTVSLNLVGFPRWCRLQDSGVLSHAEQLRGQLLQFRFDRVDSIKIPKEASSLGYPKRGMIAGALVAPFKQDVDFCKGLAKGLEDIDYDRTDRLPLDKSAVNSAAFHVAHDERWKKDGEILMKDLAKIANGILEERGAGFRLKARRVGAILDGLGFPKRTRHANGCRLLLEEETFQIIHQAAKVYGVIETNPYEPRGPIVECQWCRKLELLDKREILRYEEVLAKKEARQAQEAEGRLNALKERHRQNPLIPKEKEGNRAEQDPRDDRGVGKNQLPSKVDSTTLDG